MIGHDRDERLVEQSTDFQLPHQLSDDGVFVCNAAVIGFLRVTGLVRFGRIVRIVRVVEVDPEKKWVLGMRAKPSHGMGQHLIAAAHDGLVAALLAHVLGMEVGIVGIESPLEAGRAALWIERQRTKKCGGLVAVRTQNLGA